MSLRLGMILSCDCTENVLELLRTELHLEFIRIQNITFSKQLSDDEMLIEATGLYDDSKTGIGSFDLYNKDISEIKERYKNDPYAYHVVVDEYLDRRDAYRKDALKWLDIIKSMRWKYSISKVGLFYFDGYEITARIKFPIYIRKYYILDETNEYDLMKIGNCEIAFFE